MGVGRDGRSIEVSSQVHLNYEYHFKPVETRDRGLFELWNTHGSALARQLDEAA